MSKWSITAKAARGAASMALLAMASAVHANELSSIRLHDAPDSTRVVLDTRSRPTYTLFTMENPPRLVIDLRDTAASPKLTTPKGDSRVVKRIRTAKRKRDDYRVVLDLRQTARHAEFVLAPVRPYGHRLVVDLFPSAGTSRPRTEVRAPDGERDAVVAIDAGHGGEDPGAVGVGRVYEKTVVLAIARAVKKNLDAMPGMRAVLVRDGDYYVPLRKRTALARRADVRADLFVSIHADAFRLASVRGASVYALSRRGASSEMARWLAASENKSDLIGGVGGSVSLDEVEDSVAELLVDLSMDHKMEASIALGEAVLGTLKEVTRLHKSHVELAGFVVLKAPDVPSILVETGFISNPTEARRLASARHQRRLARAIADGIQGYLLHSPPPDTLLASLSDRGSLSYVIKRGDTLSEIAERNRVSLHVLRTLNSLTSDHIRVGQVLLIPFAGSGG